MSFEDLLFALVLLAIAFVNVVLPWLRRRLETARRSPVSQEDATPGNEDAPETVAPGQAASVPMVAIERPLRVQSPVLAPGAQLAAPGVLHASLTSLAEARRGIVLRAILGPCRAQEPFDGFTS